MRSVVRWLPVIAVFGSASCAFLLDFDELQAEAGDAGSDSSVGGSSGSGGAGGSGGTAGSGGSGGASGSGGMGGSGGSTALACKTPGVSAECDDGDPLTTDLCVQQDAGPNVCFHAGKLIDDGVLDLLPTDYLGGLGIAAGKGRFYVSRYYGSKKPGDAGGLDYDTAVFEVPTTGALQKGTELVLGSKFGGNGPRGPVGLVHDGSTLTGFVAFENGLGDWRVKSLVIPDDLKSAPATDDLCSTAGCYDIFPLDGTRRPVPFVGPSGKPGAIWSGPGGIWFFADGVKPTAKTISANKVTGLAPIVSDVAVGAFWRDDAAPQLTFPNGKSGSVTSCFAKTGAFVGLTAAGRGRLWLGAFASQPLGPVITELNSFFVTGKGWDEISNCESADNPTLDGVSLPGVAAYKRPLTSSDQRVHFAVAGVKVADSSLSINASYVELAPSKLEVVAVGAFEMIGVPSAKLKGPVDQPVVAYADDRLLVAWRDGDVLRLRRFKMAP